MSAQVAGGAPQPQGPGGGGGQQRDDLHRPHRAPDPDQVSGQRMLGHDVRCHHHPFQMSLFPHGQHWTEVPLHRVRQGQGGHLRFADRQGGEPSVMTV